MKYESVLYNVKSHTCLPAKLFYYVQYKIMLLAAVKRCNRTIRLYWDWGFSRILISQDKRDMIHTILKKQLGYSKLHSIDSRYYYKWTYLLPRKLFSGTAHQTRHCKQQVLYYMRVTYPLRDSRKPVSFTKAPPAFRVKAIRVTYCQLSAKTQFYYYSPDVYMIFVE